MNQSLFNPWAPPLLNGFNDTAPDNCEDREGGYVWPRRFGFQVLTANEQRSEVLPLDHDSDFRFMAFQWTLQSIDEGATPGFLYRIRGSDGKFISAEGYEYCFCTPGTFANPWPIFPHEQYSVHQRIEFEIINLLDADQGVQLVFRGPKRYQRNRR